jgi:hypothetical protein
VLRVTGGPAGILLVVGFEKVKVAAWAGGTLSVVFSSMTSTRARTRLLYLRM